MLESLLACVVAAHGVVHLVGVARAAGFVSFEQKRQRARPLRAVLWLFASLALLATAVAIAWHPSGWWIFGSIALVGSQAAILTEWSDARFGTLVNVAILIPLVIALTDLRSSSLSSMYRDDSERILVPDSSESVVRADELFKVPPLVRWYLMRAGVVGTPRVHNIRARFVGEMRSAPDAPWMKIRAEEVERFEAPARFFHMYGVRQGFEMEALHAYDYGAASMHVRFASVIPILDVRGPEMNESETVTFLNDMCLLAPSALLDANIEWQNVGERVVRATFTNAGIRVSGELTFDEQGDLALFRSYDRWETSDGIVFRKLPWSTPVSDYRDYGGVRLPRHGEAVWSTPEGELPYARFDLESLEMNVGSHHAQRLHASAGAALGGWRAPRQ